MLKELSYDDLFSNNPSQQTALMNVIMQNYSRWLELLSPQPAGGGGDPVDQCVRATQQGAHGS